MFLAAFLMTEPAFACLKCPEMIRTNTPAQWVDCRGGGCVYVDLFCRNNTCGRMLAELNGIEVLVTTAHSGHTSRAKVGLVVRGGV